MGKLKKNMQKHQKRSLGSRRPVKSHKKGVELSLNTVIIAIICLVVLVVIIFIFYNQISMIAKSFFGLSKNATTTAEEQQSNWFSDIFGKKEDKTKTSGGSPSNPTIFALPFAIPLGVPERKSCRGSCRRS